jgi:hypothetical protein
MPFLTQLLYQLLILYIPWPDLPRSLLSITLADKEESLLPTPQRLYSRRIPRLAG